MSAKQCTTHHHACDCREEKFRAMEQQLAELREAANNYMTHFTDDAFDKLAALLEQDNESKR